MSDRRSIKKTKREKYHIKPFTHYHYTRADEDKALKTCRFVAHSWNEILTGNATRLSFEEQYRHVYSLVLHKHGEKAYKVVKLAMRAASMLPYERGKLCAVMIRDIAMFLDKVWCVRYKKTCVYNLWEEMYAEREERARKTIARIFPSAFKEWYLAPGGPYEKRVAAEARWAAKSE